MQYRLFTPLRIVITLFACVFLLVLLVAVYQAQRGPFLQQENARANEVRRILQESQNDSANAGDADTAPEGDEATTPSGERASGDSMADVIFLFAKQTRQRFPDSYNHVVYSPLSFPQCMTDGLERNIAQYRELFEGEKTWLVDYDNGRLKLPVFAEMTESDRTALRAKRQHRLGQFRKTLENREGLLARIRNDPEGIWKELLAYFEDAKILRDVEECLRVSPESLPPEARGMSGWFSWRAVLETHASRYDAAVVSFDVACGLQGRCYANKRPERTGYYYPSACLDDVLQYIVDEAPLNVHQRNLLMSALSRRANAECISEELRILAAQEEEPLDKAEMAQLKLDSAGATVYRSPFEIATQIAPILDTSIEEGLHALTEAQKDLRAVSGTPYASSSPSFLGPRGRVVRYINYVSSRGEESDATKNKPPTVTSTAKFVEKAISLVEGYMRIAFSPDIVRTALALKDYKAAHGRYPDKLEDVMPEFLPKIPILPWTGQPIVYTAPDPVSGAGFALSSDVGLQPNWRDTLWSAAR